MNIKGTIDWSGTCEGRAAIIVSSDNIFGQLYTFMEPMKDFYGKILEKGRWEKVAESKISVEDFREKIKVFNLHPEYKLETCTGAENRCRVRCMREAKT